MEISKMLTISTAHITERTGKLLDEEILGLCVYKKLDYGWFIHLLDDLDKIEIPEDLRKCLSLAQSLGCEWLCLDCDGEVLDFLDVYEW